MKKLLFTIKFAIIELLFFNSNAAYSEQVLPSPNGIEYPSSLRSWKVISTSYRTNNNTQRVILEDSIAIKAPCWRKPILG